MFLKHYLKKLCVMSAPNPTHSTLRKLLCIVWCMERGMVFHNEGEEYINAIYFHSFIVKFDMIL